MVAARSIRGFVCGAATVAAILFGPGAAKADPDSSDVESSAASRHAGRHDRHHRSHASHESAHEESVHAAGDPRQTGNASFYSGRLSGRKTASGQRYDPNALTAAHRTLPLGTKVRVVNPKNDRSVVVTVNDRGPVPKNRVLDVSSAAADALGMKKSGVTKVETEVIGHVDPSKAAAAASDEAPNKR